MSAAVVLGRTMEDIQQASCMPMADLHCMEEAWAALASNNLSSPSHAPASDSKYRR